MKRKDILDQIQLRQSSIKDYLACPMMFRLKHLEGVKPSFRRPAALHGTVLHRLIYLIHDSKWNLKVEHYYRDLFEELEFYSSESDIPVLWKDREKELSRLEANAIEIIEGYRSKRENREAFIMYAEQSFRVKIHGLWFHGIIDQVRRNADGTIELIDFKSGRQFPTIAFLENDWQLNLYTYALRYGEVLVGDEWIRPRLLPTYSSWYFLRHHEIRKRTTNNGEKGSEKGEPLVRTEKDMETLKLFKRELKHLLNVMLRDWHFPNPNHCSICAFSEECRSRSRIADSPLIDLAKERLKKAEVV